MKTKNIFKNHIVTTSASILRSPFFYPTLKPPKNQKKIREFLTKIKNINILVRTNSYLTQKHKDILRATILTKEQGRFTETGSYQLLFSLNKVFIALNGRTNKNEIKEKLEELRFAAFSLSNPENKMIIYDDLNILNKFKLSFVKSPASNKGGDIYYYLAEISAEYIKYMDFDINIFISDNLQKEIINLKSGYIKSLIDYCLTYNILNKDLEQVLNEIYIINDTIDKGQKSRIIKNIINDKSLINFGIEIKKMKNNRYGIFYKKNNNVYFINKKIEIEYQKNNNLIQ